MGNRKRLLFAFYFDMVIAYYWNMVKTYRCYIDLTAHIRYVNEWCKEQWNEDPCDWSVTLQRQFTRRLKILGPFQNAITELWYLIFCPFTVLLAMVYWKSLLWWSDEINRTLAAIIRLTPVNSSQGRFILESQFMYRHIIETLKLSNISNIITQDNIWVIDE